MNNLIQIGKTRTILISISLVLFTLHSIYFYNVTVPVVNSASITRQVVRLALWIALLYLIFQGKNWARIVSIVLLSIGILIAILGFLTTSKPFPATLPFLVMIFVYSVALYHFGFSKSYKAFANFQRNKGTNPEE